MPYLPELPNSESETTPRLLESIEHTMPQSHRAKLIRQRAYALAECRGFMGQNCLEDWLQAEREVDAQLPSTQVQQQALDP